jgi:uncharacterized protein
MLQSPKIKYAFLAVFVIAAGIWMSGKNNTSIFTAPVAQTSSSSSSVIDAASSVITPAVSIGQTVIPVELATTTAAVQKGLSGRTSLDNQSGMLFIFSKPDIYRFWMPDMHFPIDIIWISDGKIVDISEDVSDDFDPANPRFYKPVKPAQYVLEVNAGFSSSKNIQVGDTVVFSRI